jgi:hypothetical protein
MAGLRGSQAQALAGAGKEKWVCREIFSLDLVLGLPMMSECAITELRLRRFWGFFCAAMVEESRLDAGV